MNVLYKILGISKQAFYQWKNRQSAQEDKIELVFSVCNAVRKDHPGMGLRTIWEMQKPEISRDLFIKQGVLMGLEIKQKRNFKRTTDSRGVTRFENIIIDKKVTGVNQVWVSDITYYKDKRDWHYITLIMDLYSRKIVGYASSKTLQAIETTIAAIKYALSWRKISQDKNLLIFHSDGGGQYYDKRWRKILFQNGLQSSMGKSCFENPHAERLNRTIKEQYLDYYQIKTFAQLQKGVVKACLMYNEKPHSELKKMSPNQFEETLTSKFSTKST